MIFKFQLTNNRQFYKPFIRLAIAWQVALEVKTASRPLHYMAASNIYDTTMVVRISSSGQLHSVIFGKLPQSNNSLLLFGDTSKLQ